MKKILIVIDCQNDFITGSLANEYAQKAVPNIVDKINNEEWDYIIATRDTHGSDYLKSNEGKYLPVEHCIYGTHGWEIEKSVDEAIKNKQNCIKAYVNKPSFGSLRQNTKNDYSTLLTVLKKIEIDNINSGEQLEVEMCGFVTEICVINNALITKSELYDCANVTVDAKCCAGITEEKHNAALSVMESCQINVKNKD